MAAASIPDDAIGQRLARLRAEAAALRAMTYAVISRAIRGADHGPESILPFLYFGELLQRVRLAGLEILGGEMMELDGAYEEVEPHPSSRIGPTRHRRRFRGNPPQHHRPDPPRPAAELLK